MPMLELAQDPVTGKWGGGLPVLIPGETPAFLSICEFESQILPPPFGATKVWGYQIGQKCTKKPGHSYIGPVVVAERGTPTSPRALASTGERRLSVTLSKRRGGGGE